MEKVKIYLGNGLLLNRCQPLPETYVSPGLSELNFQILNIRGLGCLHLKAFN